MLIPNNTHMITNNPTVVVSTEEKEYLLHINERERRHFIALIAQRNGKHGVRQVCAALSVNKNTVYRGLREIHQANGIDNERIRRKGGGRKKILDAHPEYVDIFRQIVAYDIAGLPQEANTKWLRLRPIQIKSIFAEEHHIAISLYTIRLILKKEGYTYRKPLKATSMAECKDRDAQFCKIKKIRAEYEAKREPIISVDTKKKEMIGNFRRDEGRAYSTEPVKANDHDFGTFSKGKIIPYGIYDVGKNTGYMTFGTSHDTAEFACDCIKEHWQKELRLIYPNAKSILILCDGGGSNSARGWLFKWSLIKLAKCLKIDIRVCHYPPYCSKWNPIEHRLFSQITRSWSGGIFNTIEEACELASNTRTKTGLAVFTSINRREYEIGIERHQSFEEECKKHIKYDNDFPKWNYVIKWDS